jgi:SAM-dependent methyltransferase
MLAPHIGSLIGVDTSTGMVNAFQAKISQLQEMGDPLGSKLATVCMLLESPDDPAFQAAASRLQGAEDTPARFDLIVSHLTLHHVPSLDDILKVMMECLKPGGRVALTDFEDFGEEAILFHRASKRDGVERHGIKRAEMERKMADAGLVDVEVVTAFSMNKDVEKSAGNIESMKFPFLICLGKKA